MQKYISRLSAVAIVLISTFVLNACDDNEFESDYNPDFSITGTFPTPTGFIHTGNAINCELTPEQGSASIQKFEVKFETNGTGKLNDHDENVWFTLDYIPNENEFNLIFTPTSVGNHSVKIYVKNQFGSEKEIDLNLTVTNPEFTFTVNQNTFSSFQGVNVDVLCNITKNNTGNNTFEFQVQGILAPTTVTYEGQVLNQNVWVPISNPAGWTLTFNNPNVGTQSMTILVRNTISQSSQEVSVTTTSQGFSFTPANISPVKVGEQTTSVVNVTTAHTSTKYFVKYSKSGSGDFLLVGSLSFGVWYPMTNLTNTVAILGISHSSMVDDSKLGIQIKDEFGNMQPEQIKNFTIFDDPLIELDGAPIKNQSQNFPNEGPFGGTDIRFVSATYHAIFTGRPYLLSEVTFEDTKRPERMAPLFPKRIFQVNSSRLNFTQTVLYSPQPPTYSGSREPTATITATDINGNTISINY